MLETIIWIAGIFIILVLCLIGYAVIKTLFWGGKQVKKGVTKGTQAVRNRRNNPASKETPKAKPTVTKKTSK